MHKIADNLTQVQNSIQAAMLQAGRNPREVTLLAVSKGQPAEALAQAYAWGQRDFGENYWQEAEAKMAALESLPLVWHFIGPLQTNKAAAVAKRFDWVHSVDRLALAQRLSASRPQELAPLNICIQVNIDNQDSKSGCALAEVLPLASAISQLPGLHLRGLMAIPDPANPRPAFSALRQLLEYLNTEQAFTLDTLSMGMSADRVMAIQEGATLVRVGTAIFGTRG